MREREEEREERLKEKEEQTAVVAVAAAEVQEKSREGESCVRWSWVRPGGTSCSPSRLPINQTRPNA